MAGNNQGAQEEEILLAGAGDGAAPGGGAGLTAAEALAMKQQFNQMRRFIAATASAQNHVFHAHSRLYAAPQLVQFLFANMKDMYIALLTGMELVDGIKGVHEDAAAAMNQLGTVKRSLEAFKASFDASCRCYQHHFDVFEETYMSLRSSVMMPEDDVLAGRTRLFDLKDTTFKAVVKLVKERRTTSPMEEKPFKNPQPYKGNGSPGPKFGRGGGGGRFQGGGAGGGGRGRGQQYY
ncbi:hypothetical protein GPECTOR_359g128 [Gonium pectorale]|uniref:Uncharacterized protein n=1 Tax=Gonium pectorale TaxID=33097 RepID=A0A150FVK9_GONPE|nr:hypothetical protein GPECTOR_359g128 [Gonium pectorale]|eukprot:KXZ41618.1 hypothetical protein GPECTOR_359g128 [Gonium pectorale]